MKKIKTFMKKNVTSLIVFMILLILVLAGIVILSVLLPTTRISKYGDRLENIEKIKIESSRLNILENEFSKIEGVTSNDIRIIGKIININIVLNKDVTEEKGKEISASLLKLFSNEEVDNYDFQVFISINTDKEYAVIGYKNPSSTSFSFTNN